MKRTAFATILIAAAGACTSSSHNRTMAASQPTPAAFDASQSDPKALATVDASLTAMGGLDKFQAIKELSFELKYVAGGKLVGWFHHRWDRWNGRHQFQMADSKELANPDFQKISLLEVRYDLYDKDRVPYATYGGMPVGDSDATQAAEQGREHLQEDGYFLLAYYKVRDPGVRLADAGETKGVVGADDLCKPTCNSVKITFDPAVGKNTWQIDYNSETHLPQILERIVDEGRVAFRIEGWADVGGLKWPTKLTNIGSAGQSYEFASISVEDPKDGYYEAPVDRSQGTGVKTEGRPVSPITCSPMDSGCHFSDSK